MSWRPHWRLGLLLAAAAILSAATIAPIWLAYRAIPASEMGSAYTLGARLALTSDHVKEIAAGRSPAIRFRRREHDSANKYVWQQAALVRSGNCLDVTSPQGERRALPERCRTPNSLEPQADRLYFRIREDQAITIGVSSRPPTDGRMLGRGAMFAVEGQIHVGRTFETSSSYKIEVDATELDPDDLAATDIPAVEQRESTEADECDRLREVRLRAPFPLPALPAMAAKVCRFPSKDKKVLALAQYRSGPMQLTRVSAVVMCKALLTELLDKSAKADLAGCLGAHWNEREAVDLNLVLFEVSPAGALALLP